MPFRVPAPPTAMQLVAEVQDTPNRPAIVDPFGPAHLVAVHDLPFHTSAKPVCVNVFPVLTLRPVMTQCDGEKHQTSVARPMSRLTAPACCGVNALPFQVASTTLSDDGP